MPHEEMNEKQVAAYLHMDLRELLKLASRGKIPCRKVAGVFRFRKSDVGHWVESQMPLFGKERLDGIEKGVSAHHGLDENAMIVSLLIPAGGLAAPLEARTRDSVLRELVDLADRAGLVYSKSDLVGEVSNREKICSTALAPGVAMPHPRHPLPYDIAASFVVAGLTSTGIPFGAVDGSLTRLFFLICCKDDRTHLHVLARLARMLNDRRAIDELLDAASPDELRQLLLRMEQTVIRTEEQQR